MKLTKGDWVTIKNISGKFVDQSQKGSVVYQNDNGRAYVFIPKKKGYAHVGGREILKMLD